MNRLKDMILKVTVLKASKNSHRRVRMVVSARRVAVRYEDEVP